MVDGKLENRYIVTHKDGVEVDPNKQYFVIELTNPDEREAAAISAFCDKADKTSYPFLAHDIRDVIPANLVRHNYSLERDLAEYGFTEQDLLNGAYTCDECGKPLKKVVYFIGHDTGDIGINLGCGSPDDPNHHCTMVNNPVYELSWPFIGKGSSEGFEKLGFEVYYV
jgi:hypothetical protein